VVISETVLGFNQLIVSEDDQVTGNDEMLVLQPGTDNTNAVHRYSLRSGSRHAVQLDAAGGCGYSVYAPTVVGSEFGPLVDAGSDVECGQYESMAVISGLYQFTGVSAKVSASGASQSGYYLRVDDWAGCTLSSSGTFFQTAGLWSINGALQGGLTSAWVGLGCAPL
jgi:hypothetical protein